MSAPAFDAQEFVRHLPDLPGVYRMLGAGGEVLYVGKARNLKNRVGSYFRKSGLSPRIAHMVSQVRSIETTVTRSDSEALLLENTLIKGLKPRYNILFRDDKSYPYLVLSGHATPRLRLHRGTLDRRDRAFGPFPNASAARESLRILQRVFRLRTCPDSVFSHRSRPCMLHQIKRCSAPCVGAVTAEAYAADVANAALFLEGRENQVIDALSGRMLTAAESRHYELAAELRDQVRALASVRERQFVESGSETDADVAACVSAQGLTCVNLVMIRAGRHLGDKSFFPDNADGSSPAETLEAFLSQHYLERAAPPLVLLSEKIDTDTLQAFFAAEARPKVTFSTRPQGERRVWVEMAAKNAELAIGQRLALRGTQETRLQALRDALGLPELHRIECFDISHTMGEATVASCVVYDQDGMQPGEYRRFNITGVTPGDDPAAMRHALNKRYHKAAAGEGRLPGLILIDGGVTQLNAAVEALRDLGLDDVPAMGVSKGPERKAGLEQLVFPAGQNLLQWAGPLGRPGPGGAGNARLPKDHPGLHLIQQIRDEAHRFAISGHRAKRARARVHSSLEEIEGVGAKRRQKLLTQFGGLQGVAAASVDDLAAVEGISRQLAEKIFRSLH